MKTKLTYTLLFVLFGLSKIFAQNAHFVQNGIIEYEKRSNMHAIIKRKINKDNEAFYAPMFESYKKSNPQFKVSKSSLSFTSDKSLYKYPPSDEPMNNNWVTRDIITDARNTVSTDFKAENSITQKSIYEEMYLVKDSLRKINWKITDETRVIAGFDCRRANAVIMDSVYVVAYYANEIAVSGGPESFTGLPGMILGLALPHENITWFATKVTEVAIPEKDLTPPAKGKPVDKKALQTILKGAMKDWGSDANTEIKGFLL